jgi:hypothetical protein
LNHGHGRDDPSAPSRLNFRGGRCLIIVGTEGWTERRYVDDALAATERWSAILTIVVQPPTDADRLKKNPLGVYVHALNWSKELG